jgi:hypothetical protein
VRLLSALRETPIGRALIAYFVDLPRWTLLNIAFALALTPSVVAVASGETVLAFVLSFPAALVMAAILRLLSLTIDGSVPYWSKLWSATAPYIVTLSVWVACVLAGLVLLTPLSYLMLLPALILFLIAPLVVGVSARLHVNLLHAWRNGFVIAVRYPMVALGLVFLMLIVIWALVQTGGALIVVLPGLWAAIAVYTVDDIIRTTQEQTN